MNADLQPTPRLGGATWFKFPISYWDDRRLFRLRRLLGKDATMLPARVWSYAVTHAPEGGLENVTAEELADAIRYEGDPDQMLAGLCSAGFIDEGLQIVGWEELFALARSRVESARKAGLRSGEARRGIPAAPPAPPYKPEETTPEEKRGEERRV